MTTSLSNYRTAESVSPAHPDKLCDRISDAILDAYLEHDPEARTAVETVGGHGRVFITGEVRSTVHPELEPIVRRIAGKDIDFEIHIVKQSPEIARGVDTGGAGDQGIMVGYATDETPEFLPLEVVLSRDLNQFLYAKWPYDGKTQVTLAGGNITAIVASFQHAAKSQLESAVREWLTDKPIVDDLVVHANPAGDWNVGGFDADAGLTGRKLVVDNYGPRIAIGGGCYSGKDASKVDRSAAYMARKIAVDYLKKYQAHEVYCRLAYAIGYDQPLEASVIIDGVERRVESYDLTPRGITEFLDLTKPQFEKTAEYGHYGHAEFAWEK